MNFRLQLNQIFQSQHWIVEWGIENVKYLSDTLDQADGNGVFGVLDKFKINISELEKKLA